MNSLMNRMFNFTSSVQRHAWVYHVGSHISIQGAQAQLAKDLQVREKERRTLFKQELAERETADVLDRALLRAWHSKLSGAISAVEYH